jgi:adenylyltransferase/sulfurtransferase
MLQGKEKQRYLRHILLDEIGEEGQVKLKNAKVLVIGAGGLGCPILQYLTAAGVGKIGIIDDDVVDVSNLQRQVLYSEKNIGELKVIAAQKRLEEMNSSIEILAYIDRLTANNAKELFLNYDIIVEGSDNFNTKYLANDTAILTDKPLVFGSIYKFSGQVSVFNYQHGPTYRCLYPEPGVAEEMPSCSDVGVLGILPAIIGSLQANEVLKMILGIGKVLSGKLLLFDSLKMQQQVLPFSKNPEIKINKLEEVGFKCERAQISLTFDEFRKRKDELTLLDVRTGKEREVFHIGGTHVPISELKRRVNELNSDKSYLVYCASGQRSQVAISLLRKFFPNTTFYNLEGGLKNVK